MKTMEINSVAQGEHVDLIAGSETMVFNKWAEEDELARETGNG